MNTENTSQEKSNEIVRALFIPTHSTPKTTLMLQSGHLAIREMVGGVFDCVRSEYNHAYVHDEGLLLGLPINVVATALFGTVIAGDALVFGSFSAKGEYDGYEHHVEPNFIQRALYLWQVYEMQLESVSMRESIL